MDLQGENIEALIEKRFSELPEAVQEAVSDTRVEKKLRELASNYKLHLDQWTLLENEIMLTLLGLEDPENMAKNIAEEVGIAEDVAQKLVDDIAMQVFKPIREKMQTHLDSESLQRETVSPSKNTRKASPSDTTAYVIGQKSNERFDVQEDPYRESID
ncbi:hypothetical protein CL644_01205 [bacterium]|nr:hypothetical protein [Parcubacteria group bacterium]MBF05305.1 hypothetical protein [bacterium]|tara:strand:- start:17501 stop:17974 length:474 start_codon:yes stop_codon:yes gene_type:complete